MRDKGPVIPHGLTVCQTTTLCWWVQRSIVNWTEILITTVFVILAF